MKKILFVITAALFFYSCASAPSSSPAENLEEQQPIGQVTEQVPEQVTEQPEAEEDEEEPNQNLDGETESEADADTTDGEESEEEPSMEPVEDVEGYFETEIEPEPAEEDSPAEEDKEDSTPEENGADEPVALLDQESNPRTGAVVKENPEIIRAQSPEAEATGSTVESKTAAITPAAAEPSTATSPAVAPVTMQEPESAGTVAAPRENDSSQVQVSELKAEEVEAQEEPEAPAVAKIEIVPSRTATMKNNQYLDIEYPGKGWIYLGEEDSKELMRYFGKKIGERNTTFCLRSRETGTTILHFYKNDALTDRVIDDYLIVEISGTNDGTKHAVAPLYADTIPQKPEKPSEIARRKALEESLASQAPNDDEAESTKITEVKPQGTQKAPASASSTPAASASGRTPADGNQNARTAPKAAPSASPSPAAVKAPVVTPSPSQAAAPSITAEDSGAVTVIENRNSTGENNSSSGEGSHSITREEPKVSQAQKEKQNAKIQDTSDMAAEEILKLARQAYDEKKYAETLAYLEDFFAKAATKIDEGLFIQGQIFESNNPFRNIKSALDTYETIVRRYPQSIHWAKANERVTYLRKFYFNIR